MKNIFKIGMILILALLVYNNIDMIKQEIKKDFRIDYCNEVYKGRTDLIMSCINE